MMVYSERRFLHKLNPKIYTTKVIWMMRTSRNAEGYLPFRGEQQIDYSRPTITDLQEKMKIK